MSIALTDSDHIIARLEAVLAEPSIPAREAENGALLLDRLTRPVRVGVFGLSFGGDAWLMEQLLGPGVLPHGPEWPTLEVVHGPQVLTHATFEAGHTTTYAGPASAALLLQEPVFLRIEAPNDMLTWMRCLYLASDDAPDDYLAALDWAAARTDVVLWATRDFGPEEAVIWDQAPDNLKNHAHLVTTSQAMSLRELRSRSGYDFDGLFSMPKDIAGPADIAPLMNRLEADISEARAADLDAAHLFLHRLGHLVPDSLAKAAASPLGRAITRTLHTSAQPPQPMPQGLPVEPAETFSEPDAAELHTIAPLTAPTAPAEDPVAEPRAPAAPALNMMAFRPDPDRQDILSEPLLYLKRRSRALLELVEWHDVASEGDDTQELNWAEEVLAHCCETTEGLQMRAMDWPDEAPGIIALRRSLDEACDTAILLQVEGGEDQAEDAATLLLQLRGDMEHELAA